MGHLGVLTEVMWLSEQILTIQDCPVNTERFATLNKLIYIYQLQFDLNKKKKEKKPVRPYGHITLSKRRKVLRHILTTSISRINNR